jgi:AcrR family transcriptional regulator
MAPKRKLPFKPRMSAAARRQRIESAAGRLFAERAYEGTSLEEVARAAGITRAVVYDHFGSKAALHCHLLELHTEQLLDSVSRSAATSAPTEERMRAGLDAFFGFVEQDPFAWRMIFRDPPLDPEVAEVHRQFQRRASESIALLLRSGHVADRDTQYFEMLAEGFKWATNGLAAWWYEHRDVPREHLVAMTMDLVWVGFGRLERGERWTSAASAARHPTR